MLLKSLQDFNKQVLQASTTRRIQGPKGVALLRILLYPSSKLLFFLEQNR